MHRRSASRLAALALLGLLSLGSLSRCRADGPVHYFADRTFEIPYSISPERTFRQLNLFVSTDGRSYTRVGSSSQREGAFTYTARGDGWYYFIVQVEELDGSTSPRNVNGAPPGMRVCIDTEKPMVQLRPVMPRQGKVAVEWTILDRNVDLSTLRLDYRPAGTERWLPLNIRQLERAQFDWDPAAPGPYEVRLIVSDRAKNTTTQTSQVNGDPARPTSNPVSSTPSTGDRRVIYINKKTFKLTYKIDRIGPSRVKHIEVWMTRDTTQWQRYPTEAPPEGPFELTFNATGRYGITLRPLSGVGRGSPPPRAGDLPQVWVEVDETPPVVQIGNVVVGEGQDSGFITVQYRAEDRFLADTPITLYYATNLDGEWKVMQEKLENTGSARCPTQGLPFEFYVRVEAVDRAGNKAHAQTAETVKVDLAVPQVIDLNVAPGETSNKPLP